jgi:hypothetical protein
MYDFYSINTTPDPDKWLLVFELSTITLGTTAYEFSNF